MAKKQPEKTVKITNYATNRIKRITKHLKKHPTDAQAEQALALGKTVSTRNKPNAKLGWLSSDKNVETILRSKFVGSITKNTLNIHARILKFTKNAPFYLIPTLVNNGKNLECVLKHTSKLSNFKRTQNT